MPSPTDQDKYLLALKFVRVHFNDENVIVDANAIKQIVLIRNQLTMVFESDRLDIRQWTSKNLQT